MGKYLRPLRNVAFSTEIGNSYLNSKEDVSQWQSTRNFSLGLKFQINSNATQKHSRFLRRQDETWLPTGDFLVHKVCERVFGTWWFMHEMVVLVRF